ncbi:MAG: hypothetical protein ACTSUD_09050 [Alphaproteobacteria bacterium]
MLGLKPSLLPAALVAAGLAASLSVLTLPSDAHAGNRNGIKRQFRPWNAQRRHMIPQKRYLFCAVEKDWTEGGGALYPILRLTNNTGSTLAVGTRIYWRLNNGESAYYVLPITLQPGQNSGPIDVKTGWSDTLSCTAKITSQRVLRGLDRPGGYGPIGGAGGFFRRR